MNTTYTMTDGTTVKMEDSGKDVAVSFIRYGRETKRFDVIFNYADLKTFLDVIELTGGYIITIMKASIEK